MESSKIQDIARQLQRVISVEILKHEQEIKNAAHFEIKVERRTKEVSTLEDDYAWYHVEVKAVIT